MANRAFIVRVRTDIPAGALQIEDLMPNTSQRNLIYQPVGQSGYIPPRPQNDVVATSASGGNDITDAAYNGLAAYLLDHVESGGLAAGTGALSDSDAKDAADAIIALADAGDPLTLAGMNAAIAGVAANTELSSAGGSASTGSVLEVLRILGGEVYALPAGSITELPTGTFNPAVSGAFDDAETAANGVRKLFSTGALQVSAGAGRLASMAAATFTYLGTAGRAVAVYDQDGNNLA